MKIVPNIFLEKQITLESGATIFSPFSDDVPIIDGVEVDGAVSEESMFRLTHSSASILSQVGLYISKHTVENKINGYKALIDLVEAGTGGLYINMNAINSFPEQSWQLFQSGENGGISSSNPILISYLSDTEQKMSSDNDGKIPPGSVCEFKLRFVAPDGFIKTVTPLTLQINIQFSA